MRMNLEPGIGEGGAILRRAGDLAVVEVFLEHRLLRSREFGGVYVNAAMAGHTVRLSVPSFAIDDVFLVDTVTARGVLFKAVDAA
jgi:hypothetical protein